MKTKNMAPNGGPLSFSGRPFASKRQWAPNGKMDCSNQKPTVYQERNLDYHDNWMWSKRYRSQEVMIADSTYRKVYFHPNWSKGTAAVRGTHALNSCRHYWEIHVSHRIFGTSMMFGVGTEDVKLHVDKFKDMLGEDKNGWGLSHKGLLWHGGSSYNFTKRFVENQATKIGLLFDSINGTLTYYKDDKCLGVAFNGLHKIGKPLYPFIMSTAAKTEMTVTETHRDFPTLKDRCRGELLKHLKSKSDLNKLELPNTLVEYIKDQFWENRPMTPIVNTKSYGA